MSTLFLCIEVEIIWILFVSFIRRMHTHTQQISFNSSIAVIQRRKKSQLIHIYRICQSCYLSVYGNHIGWLTNSCGREKRTKTDRLFLCMFWCNYSTLNVFWTCTVDIDVIFFRYLLFSSECDCFNLGHSLDTEGTGILDAMIVKFWKT